MAKSIVGNCDLLISDQERKPLKDIERSLNKNMVSIFGQGLTRLLETLN